MMSSPEESMSDGCCSGDCLNDSCDVDYEQEMSAFVALFGDNDVARELFEMMCSLEAAFPSLLRLSPCPEGLDVSYEQRGFFATISPDCNILRVRIRPGGAELQTPADIQIVDVPLNIPVDCDAQAKFLNCVRTIRNTLLYIVFVQKAAQNPEQSHVQLHNFPVDHQSPIAKQTLESFGVGFDSWVKICDFCQTTLPWEHNTSTCTLEPCQKTFDICETCVPLFEAGPCFRHGQEIALPKENTLIVKLN